jgi:hypothetical protein
MSLDTGRLVWEDDGVVIPAGSSAAVSAISRLAARPRLAGAGFAALLALAVSPVSTLMLDVSPLPLADSPVLDWSLGWKAALAATLAPALLAGAVFGPMARRSSWTWPAVAMFTTLAAWVVGVSSLMAFAAVASVSIAAVAGVPICFISGCGDQAAIDFVTGATANGNGLVVMFGFLLSPLSGWTFIPVLASGCAVWAYAMRRAAAD